jgi:hypothetical protein
MCYLCNRRYPVEIGCKFSRIYYFVYYTLFSILYAKVIAILIWNNLFFQKKHQISNFKFSLKVGCVRYMHLKVFCNLKFYHFLSFRYFLQGVGSGGRYEK